MRAQHSKSLALILALTACLVGVSWMTPLLDNPNVPKIIDDCEVDVRPLGRSSKLIPQGVIQYEKFVDDERYGTYFSVQAPPRQDLELIISKIGGGTDQQKIAAGSSAEVWVYYDNKPNIPSSGKAFIQNGVQPGSKRVAISHLGSYDKDASEWTAPTLTAGRLQTIGSGEFRDWQFTCSIRGVITLFVVRVQTNLPETPPPVPSRG